MLKNLWNHLSKHRQKQFLILQFFIIFTSFLEMLSLGAVIPFLSALSNPEYLFDHNYIQPIIIFLDISSADDLVLPFTITFVILVLFAALIRMILLWAMIRLSFTTGADLSINMYRHTLYQDYEIHVSRNSSEVINGIITKTKTVTSGVIYPSLNLISSIVTVFGIIILLAMVDVFITSIALFGFGGLYLLMMLSTRGLLNKYSQIVANKSDLMIKSLQEGLEGIRDVLINNNQSFYTDLYKKSDLEMRQASWRNEIIAQSPRFGMEAIGITIIAIFAYYSTFNAGGVEKVLPLLGVFVLGAQKLLPLLQKAYGSYSRIKASKFSLLDVLALLNQPYPDSTNLQNLRPVSFHNSIELKDLSFRYNKDSTWILKNINLKISKGSVVGIVGVTGCGKSTLVDILMGLLMPTSGEMRVDNMIINNENKRSWQTHISSVPQNIYLTDSTLEQNIAFGVADSDIDHTRVKKAAQLAQISDLVESWENGYQTVVGERGMRISGGQRQRVGIARAFFKQSNVLFLDEATSALDDKTEQAVMRAIHSLDKKITVIIIAHRLTTLKNCDQILRFDENHSTQILSYEELTKLNINIED
jgi:ATP-binding cassette, subfamily B, bacterial PglK